MALYQQIFFTSLALAFAILHSMLFLQNRRFKSNLYFTIFLLLYAGNIFFDFQTDIMEGSELTLTFLRIQRGFSASNGIFALLFFYSLFQSKIPKQFWIITAGLIVAGIFAIVAPVRNLIYLHILSLLILFEFARILRSAIKDKKESAWILTVGFIILMLFSLYDVILDLGFAQPVFGITNGYPFGFVGLILAMSVYLARDFCRMSEKIISQERRARELEVERRLLQAEDERKSRELEEARRLQLSMLPECGDEIAGLRICFSMTTATEVGGDYYDYLITDDGTLILTIGDAMGHGMKAGTMVSVIKSLFISGAGDSDIPAFFKKASETIKRMKLGNLYMAMMLVRIKDRKMTISSAGMPPVYIYRRGNKSVEEIIVKGAPLGVSPSFPYQQKQTQLEPGDTVLLMSDGFAELFNDKDEMLDYDRVKEIFREAAEEPPDRIVAHLRDAGEQWRNDRPQDDDITFVVFQVRDK